MYKLRYAIHVNRAFVAVNARHNRALVPMYTIKDRQGPTMYAFGVEVQGPSTFVDGRQRGQLACGARAWVETDGPIELIDPMPYSKAREIATLLKISPKALEEVDASVMTLDSFVHAG